MEKLELSLQDISVVILGMYAVERDVQHSMNRQAKKGEKILDIEQRDLDTARSLLARFEALREKLEARPVASVAVEPVAT
jgi:indole-3-glycerol phosphate synthase